MPGGTFNRTYTNTGAGPTGEADPATVSGFSLDKYLVTVGRFRQFVTGGAGHVPTPGSGKHTHLNGGQGLANSGAGGGYEPGWVAADNSNIAPTNANLACDPTYATWTTAAGTQENLPINCANWYEAYAFCIWDGAFLPSEAEWGYAAAGGGQQREYPWGQTDPGATDSYAVYFNGTVFTFPGAVGAVSHIAPVGTTTLGAGLWGQMDMAGEEQEWILDSCGPYGGPCTDCGAVTPGYGRVVRGGDFQLSVPYVNAPFRGDQGETVRNRGYGFRCARTP